MQFRVLIANCLPRIAQDRFQSHELSLDPEPLSRIAVKRPCSCISLTSALFPLHVKNHPSKFSFPVIQKYVVLKKKKTFY